jgi:hypothetical protein
MRSGAAQSRFNSWDLQHSHFEWRAATPRDPAVAVAHQIAEAVMEVAGPLFWGALLLAFVTSLLGPDFFG